ncbi:hypothetical protein GW796_06990 [archaeon]|nr:hypothetical protein [archaeon]
MSQFLQPKFRFGLFIVDNNKAQFYKNQVQNNNSSHLYVICHADTYEIKEDGSIVFFQTLKSEDDKRFKIPILSYPNGKWEACVLLDDTNTFPVFTGNSNNISMQGNNEENSQNNQSSDYDSNQLNEYAYNNENKTTLNSNHNQSSQFIHNSNQPNVGIPGINTNNPQEFKKQKDEWLENEIKIYDKEIDFFRVSKFLVSISKKYQTKNFKITESDIVWASSKLIRNKVVMSRKFADKNIQKILALMLPDIMKRQWDGKMAPILQILQEKEETKNITAIDLAVWMVQNNY